MLRPWLLLVAALNTALLLGVEKAYSQQYQQNDIDEISRLAADNGIVLTQEAYSFILGGHQKFVSQLSPSANMPPASTGAATGGHIIGGIVTMNPQTPQPPQAPSTNNDRIIFQSLISRLGSVKITVEPIPPVEYSVYINDRGYPKTEKSTYSMPAGTFKIVIKRTGKNDCAADITVVESSVQVLKCRF